MRTVVHVLRHGEVHNPDKILYGRLPGFKLSELGRQMAKAAAEALADNDITQLLVTGVTTEVCVHTTTREANDRGFECVVVSDCVGSYFPEFQRVGLEMIAAQGGIFGWTAPSEDVITLLTPATAEDVVGSA